ncbi:hypothetical protein BT96DRAFT_159552 [Gymnopus androsaceus JB14]|uniref:DUF4246 domain-containing protein n=1 Tax=Gymnopus androsaceus JB14 TaxID=1447944 RepID=A0A6A4HAC5_9AGAR|nr:hypothetical protein BT96DRAFT_159552 [Gymnopus androsaceus JB14]
MYVMITSIRNGFTELVLLLRELDTLAAKELRDFHPGSFGKVQDLIHPSLYPYVAGVTPTSSPDVKLPSIAEGMFRTQLSTVDEGWDREIMTSSYAWIPSVFKVSQDGTDVHIDSYINGLGNREQFPGLFRVLEKIFLVSLPHFERTMEQSSRYKPVKSPSVCRWMTRREFARKNDGALTKQKWHEFLAGYTDEWDTQKLRERQEQEKLHEDMQREKTIKESFYNLGDEFVTSDIYKGKELKVIVKAVNYTLAPGRGYQGSWHMEGMPHEQIVASVIYYYDTDSTIEDKGLSFRKFRDLTADFPPDCYRHEDFWASFWLSARYNYRNYNEIDEKEEEEIEYNYPSDWETEPNDKGNSPPVSTSSLSSFIELGTVPTTNFASGSTHRTGRMLSFPNWLQHKVKSVRKCL